MAVTECVEDYLERNGDEDKKGIRTYVRQFKLACDSHLDGPQIVLDWHELPRIGHRYRNGRDRDDTALCVSRRCKLLSNASNSHWLVTCDYSSDAGEIPENNDPLAKPAEIEWATTELQVPVAKDLDDRIIGSSANEPFDPPYQQDDGDLRLRYTKNVATFSTAVATMLRGAINSDVWQGFEPGQARIASITAVKRYEQGVEYWAVAMEVAFKEEGWQPQVLDQGTYGSDGKTFLDERKQLVSKPVLMDGEGGKLAAGQDPVFRQFRTRRAISFASIGFA